MRLQAERDELAARQRAYASDMNVAKQALDANNLGRALDLLNRQRPAPDQKDLRGWEWRYLWQQTRSDAVATLCQEVSEINAISCTPDGSLLALGLRHRGGVSVWDLRSRKELIRLVEGSSYVRTAFSPSGSLLAIFSERTFPSKERVVSLQVWNVATRMIMTEVPLTGRITCLGMAFANDGKTLITSTIGDGSDLEAIMTGEITLWNMPDGEKIAQFPAVDQRGIDPGTSFAANSDLSAVAHGSSVGMLRVLDLTTGKERWKVDTGSELILSLAFSPDGKILACGNGFSNPQLTLWDVETGGLLGRLEGHQSWVSSMVFLSNGQTMATSSADQTIRIWDLASHSCLTVLRGHRQEVWRLALLPDERTLISGAKDGTVCLWDLAHPPISRGRITLPVNTLSWGYSEDGYSIVTLDDSGHVESWTVPDLSQGEQIMEIGPVTANKFYLNQFSPDGKWLAAGSSRGLIQFWDLESRSVVRELSHGTGDTQVMNFLPARNKVVTLSWQDNQLHEWDLDSGKETQVWTAASGVSFDSCGASPDGRFQVTVGYGGDTVLRDLINQKTLQTPSLALEAGPASFSPTGDLVAVSSDLGHTKVWDTGDWHEVTTLGGVLNAMMSVTFSPDATRIATSGGDDEAVKMFDTESWQDVLTLKSPGIGLRGVKISPDGNTITMGSSTGMISVWHAPTWEEIKATESRE